MITSKDNECYFLILKLLYSKELPGLFPIMYNFSLLLSLASTYVVFIYSINLSRVSTHPLLRYDLIRDVSKRDLSSFCIVYSLRPENSFNCSTSITKTSTYTG